MSRMHRDRLLGVIVAIFAAIFLMTNTYGRELPELFLQGFAIALFGFMVLVAITLLRWRLVYRLSVALWSILLMIFLIILNDEASPALHLHVSAILLIASMVWIIFLGRNRL